MLLKEERNSLGFLKVKRSPFLFFYFFKSRGSSINSRREFFRDRRRNKRRSFRKNKRRSAFRRRGLFLRRLRKRRRYKRRKFFSLIYARSLLVRFLRRFLWFRSFRLFLVRRRLRVDVKEAVSSLFLSAPFRFSLLSRNIKCPWLFQWRAGFSLAGFKLLRFRRFGGGGKTLPPPFYLFFPRRYRLRGFLKRAPIFSFFLPLTKKRLAWLRPLFSLRRRFVYKKMLHAKRSRRISLRKVKFWRLLRRYRSFRPLRYLAARERRREYLNISRIKWGSRKWRFFRRGKYLRYFKVFRRHQRAITRRYRLLSFLWSRLFLKRRFFV